MRLLAPGRGINMGDGWETRRRREPGYDWMIIALGARGEIEKAVIDTAHFKGNFPTRLDPGRRSAQLRRRADGRAHHRLDVLEGTPAAAETRPRCRAFLPRRAERLGPVTHVRFNIFPDGGVSRLRLFGTTSA
jgi:allantoicase